MVLLDTLKLLSGPRPLSLVLLSSSIVKRGTVRNLIINCTVVDQVFQQH